MKLTCVCFPHLLGRGLKVLCVSIVAPQSAGLAHTRTWPEQPQSETRATEVCCTTWLLSSMITHVGCEVREALCLETFVRNHLALLAVPTAQVQLLIQMRECERRTSVGLIVGSGFFGRMPARVQLQSSFRSSSSHTFATHSAMHRACTLMLPDGRPCNPVCVRCPACRSNLSCVRGQCAFLSMLMR